MAHKAIERTPVDRAAGRGGMALLLALLFLAAVASTARGATVGLGAADSFAVLGGTTIDNTGPSVISGDLGLSPGSAVVGFPPGTVINGTSHVNNGVAAQAQLALTTAYNDAAGRSSTSTVVGDLAGQTLPGGVYTSASSLGLTGDLTLDGENNPDAVFVFQAGSSLTTAAGSRVLLTRGAQACNVFWQIGSAATLGSTTAFTGTILALSSIELITGATINGRALARNGQVRLDTNTITRSVCATPTTTPAVTAGTTTPVSTPAATPVSTPGATRRTTTRRKPTTTAAERRRGTSRLSGPRAPVSGPFTIRVTGRNIRDVTFYEDGKRVGSVQAKQGRKVFVLHVDPRLRRRGVRRITARVRYKPASRSTSTTHRFTFQPRIPVRPRFTG